MCLSRSFHGVRWASVYSYRKSKIASVQIETVKRVRTDILDVTFWNLNKGKSMKLGIATPHLLKYPSVNEHWDFVPLKSKKNFLWSIHLNGYDLICRHLRFQIARLNKCFSGVGSIMSHFFFFFFLDFWKGEMPPWFCMFFGRLTE